MPNEARFYLDIPAHRYLAYYRGAARTVVVTAYDGRVVRFPAAALRPHVTHDGVRGEFVLEYDSNHRLLGLRRAGKRA